MVLPCPPPEPPLGALAATAGGRIGWAGRRYLNGVFPGAQDTGRASRRGAFLVGVRVRRTPSAVATACCSATWSSASRSKAKKCASCRRGARDVEARPCLRRGVGRRDVALLRQAPLGLHEREWPPRNRAPRSGPVAISNDAVPLAGMQIFSHTSQSTWTLTGHGAPTGQSCGTVRSVSRVNAVRIAVVHQRRIGEQLRRRKAQRSGFAPVERPLHHRWTAEVARVDPVGVPALVQRMAERDVDRVARGGDGVAHQDPRRRRGPRRSAPLRPPRPASATRRQATREPRRRRSVTQHGRGISRMQLDLRLLDIERKVGWLTIARMAATGAGSCERRVMWSRN